MGFSLSVLQYFDIYHTVYAAMLKFPQDVQFRNCILRKYFNIQTLKIVKVREHLLNTEKVLEAFTIESLNTML